MGSLAAEDYDFGAGAGMYTETDFMEPQFLTDLWGTQHSASIFSDCSSSAKDWNSSPSLATPSSSSAAGGLQSSETQSSLFIDSCCDDFGDPFFGAGYQSTPISVLDYYLHTDDLLLHPPPQQQQENDQEEPDIQELLAGFNRPQFLPQQQPQQSSSSPMSISSQGSSSFTPPELHSQHQHPHPQPHQQQMMIKSEPPTPAHQHHLYHHQQQQQQQMVAIKQEPQNQQQQQQQQHYTNHQPHYSNHIFNPVPLVEPVDRQLRLVRLLLACAAAVSDGNTDVAGATLAQLRGMVVPHGSPGGSPMERLASYVTEALVARLSRATRSSNKFRGLVPDQLQRLSRTTRSDMLEAFWVFYQHVPIGKFTHLTMNQMLLDAAADHERAIHVIDFQVWYGAQWPSFLQSLALRPGGPPMLRMTAVGSSLRDLQEAGTKLLDCARGLGVPFEYCLLNVELEQFHAGMIELRDGEVVLINSLCQFHCFLKRDEGCVEAFLQGLRALRPRLVVMAENDAEHNSPVFLNRFMACLQYYSAVFDAFDASLHMPATLKGRQKLEELIAAQKLRNMIACEGSERVERHESMRTWNVRMETAGFRGVSVSHKAISQASLLLRLYFSNGYTLTNEDGFLILGWRGMPLNGVGAWI